METLFVGKSIAPNIGPLLVPGCKGLQPSKVNDGYRSSDRNLEGVRSLGAALIDGNFVCRKSIAPILGLYWFPAARDCSPASQSAWQIQKLRQI
jgi:hypothetical protein